PSARRGGGGEEARPRGGGGGGGRAGGLGAGGGRGRPERGDERAREGVGRHPNRHTVCLHERHRQPRASRQGERQRPRPMRGHERAGGGRHLGHHQRQELGLDEQREGL